MTDPAIQLGAREIATTVGQVRVALLERGDVKGAVDRYLAVSGIVAERCAAQRSGS